MLMNLKEKDFDAVIASPEITLVDFFAPWCMPCQMMLPIIDKIAEKNPDIRIVKMNIEETGDIATKQRVKSVPTFMIFQNGEMLRRWTGFMDERGMQKIIDGVGTIL